MFRLCQSCFAPLVMSCVLTIPAVSHADFMEPHQAQKRRQDASQSVRTEGARLALLAGYHYWPQNKFENSAAGAGYMLDRRGVGGPQVGFEFGYRVAPSWDVAIEIGYTWERIAFSDGASSHSSLPLMFAARWLPWPGGFEPFFGVGAGYILNFYSGGVFEYLESHAMGVMADAGFFFPFNDSLSVTAELRFSYGVSEMNKPFRDVMCGGLSLLVGIQWGFRPKKRELF